LVHVVDQQRETTIARTFAQPRTGPVEQRGVIVLSGPEVAGEVVREQVCERAEGDRPGRGVAHGASRGPRTRRVQHLFTQARLADPGRSYQHDSAGDTLFQQVSDPVEWG
jgi:hypothetical protein